MSDVSKFNVLGKIVNIKDTVARNLISTLTSTVNTLTNRVSALEDNGITILIGDSYGEGYTPHGTIKSWIGFVKDFLGGEYKTSAIGGAGFLNGTTFITQLNNLYNSMTATERSRVRRVLVAGGYNDGLKDFDELTTAVETFGFRAKQLFPKAKIYCAEIGWSKDAPARTQIYNIVMPAYAKGSGRSGMIYCGNGCYVLHDYTLIESDNIHPTINGQAELGRAIASYLKGDTFDCIMKWRDLQMNGSIGTFEGSPLGASMINDEVYLTWLTTQISTSFITLRGGEWVTLGTLPEGIIDGYILSTPFCSFNVNGWAANANNQFYSFNAIISIDDRVVSMYITQCQPDASGYFVMTGVNVMRLFGNNVTIPAYLC